MIPRYWSLKENKRVLDTGEGRTRDCQITFLATLLIELQNHLIFMKVNFLSLEGWGNASSAVLIRGLFERNFHSKLNTPFC